MAEQEVQQIQGLPGSEEERQGDEQPPPASEKPAEEEPEKPAEEEPEKPTEAEPEKPTEAEPEKPTEAEPEKPTEAEPEKPTEAEPEKPTEAEPEKPTEAEPEKPTEAEPEKPTEAEPEKPTEAEPEKPSEEEPEKPSEEEPEKPSEEEPEKPSEEEPEKPSEPEPEKPSEAEPEKPSEAEPEKPSEAEPEKPAEAEPEKPTNESEKPAAQDLEKPVEKEAGKLVELEPSVEKPEEKQPEASENLGAAAQEQGAAAAPSAAPGSLSFPFLEEESTESTLRESRTLYILLGLPGAGKTHLATAIRDRYKEQCAVVSADEHGVQPERYAPDGHRALDAAVASCCASGTAVVVVDDTNHTSERLASLGELAEDHRYFALFLEPRTDWRRDVGQLSGRTHRGLDTSQIQALKGSLEAACYPLYYGWFLRHTFRDELEVLTKEFLKTLESLEAFKKHRSDFTAEGEAEVNLEQYFQLKGPLHCTTKFTDYGKADGAREYIESQVVQQRYGSMTQLELPVLFLTPRTLGARVALTQDQLQLWPRDTEGEASSGLPPGSRAHVTLGCAQGVEPVQTGLDLLQILQLQQRGQEGEKVADLELGPLTYYGEGVWALGLRQPLVGPALFSCFHGRKQAEELKKKKPKCTIL